MLKKQLHGEILLQKKIRSSLTHREKFGQIVHQKINSPAKKIGSSLVYREKFRKK